MAKRPEGGHPPPEVLLPLTAVAFEILLTLSDGDCHGYHIMQDVDRRTAGAIVLHPGTLYRALARLLDEALIEEMDTRASKDDERRRYYRLTREGREAARQEMARMSALLIHARLTSLRSNEG